MAHASRLRPWWLACWRGHANAKAFDIPTGAPPSPLFGALPFTQQMNIVEEFGTQPMPTTFTLAGPLPQGIDCAGDPDGTLLDTFFQTAIFPAPTRESNALAGQSLGYRDRHLLGRPVGDELRGRQAAGRSVRASTLGRVPAECVLRKPDDRRARESRPARHACSATDSTKANLPRPASTTTAAQTTTRRCASIRRCRCKTVARCGRSTARCRRSSCMARYGEAVLFRHYNALPIDRRRISGFGRHTITTHYHNGHHPAESDGYHGRVLLPRPVLRLSLADDPGRP